MAQQLQSEPDAPDAPSIPLDEFCRELSRTVSSVELLAVFAFRERAAGRNHDTEEAYKARFAGTHESPTDGNTRPSSV